MTPFDLIGRGYRLGADFVSRPEGDCLSLARFVLGWYGIKTPEPQRSWYKRLRRGDTDVFPEELGRWGRITTDLECGVVALCQAENGYGMAVWFEGGWLSFQHCGELVVRWSPTERLQVHEFYCQAKSSSAKQ